jgi:hypothetical protein
MDRRRPSPLCIGFGALALMLGCSAQNGGPEVSGTGGAPPGGGSGGDTSGSGGSGTGGSSTGSGGSGTGGSQTGTGGTQGGDGAGGTKATGGTTGTGGGKAGASGSGGAGGKAGAPGAGKAGASGTGGASATGGGGGSGGSGGLSGGGGIPFKGFAGDPTACADMQHLDVSWYYNWKQTPTSGCASTGIPFVPMVWGHSNEVSASAITSAVSSFVSKGYGYVLGFNEPDNSTQSNIPVAMAVSLWPSFNNSAIQLGTPATQANSTGQTWFTSFMGSVNGSTTLHADFIAIHWYGWNTGSCDAAASQFESYVKYAEGFSGNRPIWVTEWGCLNDSAPDTQTVLNFYKGALAVFARHPRVARYSWYPWSTNNELVNSDGTLTTLGSAYAAAPAYK